MKFFLSLLFLLTFLLAGLIYSQVTIHVPGDYATIQEAINAANNTDLVLVADGLYYENINFIGKAITVASHFIQDGDRSHIENTIINGSQPIDPNIGAVVSFTAGEDTNSVICGFKITGGTGNYHSVYDVRAGGGISLFESGAKICNNIIESNSVTYNRAYGGGILVHSPGGDITIIKNNIIRNNLLDGTYPFGGGISLANSGLTHILSNKIIDNEAIGTYASGGGIDAMNSNFETVINNNYIKNNYTQINGYGGGGIDLYNWGAPITISNNLIVENNARWGGGILVEYNLDSSSKPTALTKSFEYLEEIPVLINNTIINNFGAFVGGIYGRGSSPDVFNNIVWGNTYNTGGQIYGANVAYSDIEGGYPGTGNIDEDPEFIDLTYFCLCDSSKCVDAGDPNPIYNDVEDPNNPGYALFPAMGNLRNDMGAFGGPNSTWSSIILDTLRVPNDYATIQEAIDAAMEGNVVLVAEGTYFENINYKGKAITVASYFLVDGDESHIENTIIDGSQPSNPDSASVVTMDSGEDITSILCGLTITGGTGTYSSEWDDRNGGGVYLDSSGATIRNNIIKSNSIVFNGNALGAGIMAFCFGDHEVIIKDNLIENNNLEGTNTYGAGIALWTDSYSLVSNNKILNNIHNSVYCQGGGIHMGIGNHQFINNYVLYNSAICQNTLEFGGGGGMFTISYINMDDAPYIANNLIAYNEGTQGGGIKIHTITESTYSGLARNINEKVELSKGMTFNPVVENNTIIFNTSPGAGGGIRNSDTESEIRNSIVWGNDGAANLDQIFGSGQSVTYCNVQGGHYGDGNIDEDPMFDDTTYYCINQYSPCIDAGNPDQMYNDVEDPLNPGYPLLPAKGTLINDMGCFGGPNSLWCNWDIPVSVKGDEAEISKPVEFAISQNYPNPFNPSTIIKYEIPERSFVELRIYDILGREVELLVSEEQDAGYYELDFNASKLSSGIYLYQIKAGNFIETKKMILLK